MKKVFCSFLLFPMGISLLSCGNNNNDSKKDENRNYTVEENSHFSMNMEVRCKNGDQSSIMPGFSFSSISDAKEAVIVLEEINDGFRQKGDKVKVSAKSDSGEETIYEVENKLHQSYDNSLLVYHGTLTDLPKGSLNFKIVSDLEEQEVELKSNFVFPLDTANEYQAIFHGANNLDQGDFERLGYNAEDELEYIAQHLYIKYSKDLGFGTEEMTFADFCEAYLSTYENLQYYKYKESDNVYFDIYSKNEYVSFVCEGNYNPEEVQFKNNKKHADKSVLSMINQSIINSDGKLGFRYKLNAPDSMQIIMNFYNMLIPHDLIGVELAEFDGISLKSDNKWFQLESVNGISDNSRKYLYTGNSTLSGYAKTTDFTSANNNQIDIVYGLTSLGLSHKSELADYAFTVHSGGTASFNASTNKLTVKAKIPYLSNENQYFSRIYIDAKSRVNL